MRHKVISIIFGMGLSLALISPSWGQNFTAQIKTTPDQPVLPYEVGFEATVIGGSAPYSFTWNFGDGLASTLAKPSYIYRESGRYAVWVTVSDSQGSFGVAHKTITVGEGAGVFDSRNVNYQIFTNSSDLRSLVQDRVDPDVLWVGTTGGLVRYNKAKGDFLHFIQELPNATVTCIYQQSDGVLWVGTGGGLARFDPGVNAWTTFGTANSGLPGDYVYALLQAVDGKIWVGTSGGLVRFDPGANAWTTFNTANSGLPHNGILALLQDADGKIWIGTMGGGLARFDPGASGWTTFNTANSGLPHNLVYALLQTADGKIWVGTYRGLARLDPGANTWTTYNTANSGLPGNYVYAILQATDGKIWVGTWEGGLARLDPGANGWITYNTANSGLPSNNVFTLLQAADGKIWVGTGGGMARFDPGANAWATFKTSSSGLPDNRVYALLQAADGNLWVGMWGGLVRFDAAANGWTIYNTANSGLPSNNVYALLQAADGKLWAGTDGGLARFDAVANTWTTFITANSGLPDDYINALLQAADGKIWVGTNFGLARFDPASNAWTTFNSGLPYAWVRALLQAADGKLWVGTEDSGLARFDPGANGWTTYKTDNSGLTDNDINALLQTADGKIWVGTWGGGLARFDPAANDWTTFKTSDSGLPSDNIFALLQAADGKLWVGTNFGLTRFDPSANAWTIFNTANSGLPNNWVHTLLQTADGKIWAGTDGGLVKMTFQKVSSSSGRLVLVAGGGVHQSNALRHTTQDIARNVYRNFISRNYKHTDIFFLNPQKWVDFNGDGVDDHIVDRPLPNEDRDLTIADLQYAVTDWAVSNHNPRTPLYVYLIDHGFPDDGIHGPYFLLAPGVPLYAGALHEMLNTYETATGGQVIVINESCYSGQFLSYLKKSGRIVVSSTLNNMVNYANFGAESFSNLLMQELYGNADLFTAFLKSRAAIRRKNLTASQEPVLDDNGDGRYDTADGLTGAVREKLGGNHDMGAPWPEILSVTPGTLSNASVAFAVKTNAHMQRVWASVQPPDYTPDRSGSYQNVILEAFDLSDGNSDLTYEGTYPSFSQTGRYLITIYAKDQFGNVAVAEPVQIAVGLAGKGGVTGEIGPVLDGYAVSVANTDITVKVMETGSVVSADASGRFAIDGLPPGVYTLKIQGPSLNPAVIPNVSVNSGQSTVLPPLRVILSSQANLPGDADGNGKLGLEDALHILQVLSNTR